MSNEIITILISLVSTIFASLVSYLLTMKKNSAEIKTLKAAEKKSHFETEKIKIEIKELNSRSQVKRSDTDIQTYISENRRLTRENLDLKRQQIESLTKEDLNRKNQQERVLVPPPPSSETSKPPSVAGYF